jgi:hypothetical protein
VSRPAAARRLTGVALAGSLVAATGAVAQAWSMDVGVGSTASTSVPGAAGGPGAMAGVRLEAPVWFALYGSVPLTADGSAWALTAAGARWGGERGVPLELDVAAQAYGYRDRLAGGSGQGFTAAALPLLAMDVGPFGLEARSGVMHHSSTFAAVSAARTVHHSDLRLGATAGALRLAGVARYVRAAEGDYPFAGGEVELRSAAAALVAHAGAWVSDSLDGTAWGVEARFRPLAETELFAGYRRQAEDPLYWAGTRTTWSVGISRRLGGGRPGVAAPEMAAGRVVFRLPLSASRAAPVLAGDFTGWAPVPMVRDGDAWVVSLPVPSGVHRYAYRDGAGRWFVPRSTPGRVEDGFGGVSAVVVVP